MAAVENGNGREILTELEKDFFFFLESIFTKTQNFKEKFINVSQIGK